MIRRAVAGLLSVVLVVGGLMAAPVSTVSAAGDQDYQSAARVLNRYGLVQGDQRGFRFGDAITRAEVAKLLVYALGQGAQSDQFRGRRDFTDTAGHWADGAIALAKSQGIMNGYPEGDFRPENPVSYAEVVTAFSRLAGVGAGTEPWPNTYVRPARDAGILPADFLLEGRLEQPAIRGDVFVLLKRTVADVKNVQGQTLLQVYLDKTAPDVTVDPLPQQTQYGALPVSGTARDAAVVKINGEPVAVADGYFRQDVPLLIGPNTIRVQAFDDAGNLKEATLQVNRVPGAPNSIRLQGPPTIKVRQTASLIVTLLDENGADKADRSKLQADVSPADMGKFDPKTGLFTAGTRPGTALITVQSGTAQSSLSILVEPSVPDRIAITPAEVSLAAGESATFKAVGMDAFGNQVPLSDVLWSADGGAIFPDGRFQAPASGGAGTYTVTAAAAGRTGTARVYPTNYQVAGINLAGSVSTGLRANSAGDTALRANGVSETTLTATVVDSKGKPVTDYKGVLSVQTSDERIAVPVESTVAVVGGMAQIPIRAGTVAGTARIMVSTNLNRVGFFNVTTTAPRLQAVRLTGWALPSTDGTPMGMIEAVALDQDGNPFRTTLPQTLVIRLTVKPPAGEKTKPLFVSNDSDTADIALGQVNPATGDVRTQIMIRYLGGTGTVMIDGQMQTQTQGVQVLAGAIMGDQVGLPNRLQIEPIVDTPAGQERFIYVNVLDANGYRVTQPGPLTGIVVTLQDQTGQPWPGVQIEPGRYQFRVTQPLAGAYTYTARLQPQNVTVSAVGKVTAAGLYSVRQLAPAPVVLPADGRTQGVVKVEIVDANGNRLTAPPFQVTFHPSGTVGTASDQTVASANGIATMRVTAGVVPGDQQFDVTIASAADPSFVPMTFNAAAKVITQGLPQGLRIGYPGGETGQAGASFTIVVDVLDGSSLPITYDNGRTVKLALRNLDTGRVTKLSMTTAAGTATFTPTLKEAGTYAIKAESEGLLSGLTMWYGGTLPNAVIQPGRQTGVRPSVDTGTAPLKVGDPTNSFAWVRVEPVDTYGNVTPNTSGRPMFVDVSVTTTKNGYFTIDDNPAPSYPMAHRTVTIEPGARASNPVKLFPGAAGKVTIEAAMPDGPKESATVEVRNTGKVVKLVAVLPPVSANPRATRQMAVITAQDTGGNRVTSKNGELHVRALSGTVKIVGYFDPAINDFRTIDPTSECFVPLDRGEAKVLFEGPEGSLSAFEAYEEGTPTTNTNLRPVFYVQFELTPKAGT